MSCLARFPRRGYAEERPHRPGHIAGDGDGRTPLATLRPEDDFPLIVRAIDQRMGLPYVAIDCAENRAGELLIFEVDNAMVVHAMDPEDLFPYKKPAMRKIFVTFRQMLEKARQLPLAA